MMREKFEKCDDHEHGTVVFYDAGHRCPLCRAEDEIINLSVKIVDLEDERDEFNEKALRTSHSHV